MMVGAGMKKKLLILGAGQFGTVIKEIAQSTEKYDQIDFLDDRYGTPDASARSAQKVIGKLSDYGKYAGEYEEAIVSVGDPGVRMQWTGKLMIAGYAIPVIVSPFACVSPSAALLDGSLVAPMAVVNPGVKVGVSSFIMAGAVIDHNTEIGDYCNIHCGVVVTSNSRIPDFTVIRSMKI